MAPSSSEKPPRPFDPHRFAELRRQRGALWGEAFHYSSETGSTNDDALAAARAGAASGSVFLADHQTQGRGRRGKTWVAAPGQNLLFSIVLRPQGASSLGSALTLAVGLGVREALAGYVPGVRLGVKWPNDVLAERRKVAGILCEGQFESGRLEAVVVGIGINVYGGSAQFPAELEGAVTCLEELARGDDIERERVLADVLTTVNGRVSACLEGGFASLLQEFSEHDALAGEPVVVSGASSMVGIARGVDSEGRLLVETDGLLMPVVSGTVRAVRG